MEDYDIIKACLAGDKQAFGYLVHRYQSEAMGHALALLGNLPDALDVVQDAFLAAFQALDRFDLSCRFYPWYYTILRNRCYKHLSQRKQRAEQSPEGVPWLEAMESKTASVQSLSVQQALDRLSVADRELLILKHIDGLTCSNIAQRLNIPPGTVMSRLFQARRRFRTLYLKYQEPD